MTPTFVVGTGRCGSTMLSHILRLHPEVLSVSEFFAGLLRVRARLEKGIPADDIDGAELWRMLSAPDRFYDAIVRDGLAFPELCYPYGRGRFSPETGVPLICHMTLPMLTDDPDGLYDALAAELPAWPRRPAAEQYSVLFGWLAGWLDRSVVVERSGGSLGLVPALREQFPGARFVHMHRDGPDCALSMSRHPMFRLPGIIADALRVAGKSPGSVGSWQEVQASLPPEFGGLLAPPFDAERFLSYPIPLEFFGSTWSREISGGVVNLAELPDDARTSLAYEDLLRDPGAELTRLAAFLGVPADPGWLARARALIDARRAGKAAGLARQDLAVLRAACAAGTRALAGGSLMPGPPARHAWR